MTQAKERPEKTEDGFTIIYDAADVPTFASETEEVAYWDTHTWSDEQLERFERVPLAGDEVFPPARPRGASKRPVSIRFDEDTLMRLKQLAGKKHTNYQTLVKNFVNERLYEEEKREGIL